LNIPSQDLTIVVLTQRAADETGMPAVRRGDRGRPDAIDVGAAPQTNMRERRNPEEACG
jgi:hypothetical protein